MRAGIAAAIIALAALATPSTAARAQSDALVKAARAEGQVTWYITHYPADVAEETGRAFTRKFPGITVNVFRTTAQVAYQRLLQDLRENVAQCDVFSSTDIGHYVNLKKQNRLAKFHPENADKLIAEFRDYDPDGFYYPTNAGLVILAYNTRKVSAADAPTTWRDLIDPKWRGRVAVGHPGFSAYVGTWVVMMSQLYGWDYFEKLDKNDPLIGRSINDTVTALNSGERWIAASAAQTVLENVGRGNPLAIVYPTDGALLMVAPSAVMANAPHPNAARLLLEFLLDVEHSRIVVDNGGISLRPEVPLKPPAKSFREVKIIRPTEAQIVDGIPKVIEKWRDTFGG